MPFSWSGLICILNLIVEGLSLDAEVMNAIADTLSLKDGVLSLKFRVLNSEVEVLRAIVGVLSLNDRGLKSKVVV